MTIDDGLKYLIDKKRIQGYSLKNAREALTRFLIFYKDDLTIDKELNIIRFESQEKNINIL